jgi:hypothetical protein
MPGVVENEQARRISKSIDDDLKVGFLDYVARFILLPPPSPFTQREREQIKKRQKQRKDVKGASFPLPLLTRPRFPRFSDSYS